MMEDRKIDCAAVESTVSRHQNVPGFLEQNSAGIILKPTFRKFFDPGNSVFLGSSLCAALVSIRPNIPQETASII